MRALLLHILVGCIVGVVIVLGVYGAAVVIDYAVRTSYALAAVHPLLPWLALGGVVGAAAGFFFYVYD